MLMAASPTLLTQTGVGSQDAQVTLEPGQEVRASALQPEHQVD